MRSAISEDLRDRCAILHIRPEDVLRLFVKPHAGDEDLYYWPEGVPDGTVFSDVHWNYEARRLGLILYHPDFAVVPDGQMAPPIHWSGKIVRRHRLSNGERVVSDEGWIGTIVGGEFVEPRNALVLKDGEELATSHPYCRLMKLAEVAAEPAEDWEQVAAEASQ